MSCFSFNKLFPAKKTWKMFKLFKIEGKLHKLHKSKVIKKPKISNKKTSKKKKITWPNFGVFQRKKLKPSRALPAYKYYFQKTASPVYIDQLFIEPTVSVPKATPNHCSTVTLKATEANKEVRNSSSTCNAMKLVDEYGEKQVNMVGTSSDVTDVEVYHHSVDDMWESMAMSPRMNEINERAEEFIASFRAEMQLQEMIARRL